ncbi:MAG: hypothetical protein WAR24_02930 [Candidatus Acidiferrales bacterium]
MNWDQIEGKWKQSKGKFREKWGKLNKLVTSSRNNVEVIIGLLQERYGIAREEAEKQADDFVTYLSADTSEQRRAASRR